jgi:hypothetical protein
MRIMLLSSAIVLCLTTPGRSAPQLGDKPKWEYGELTLNTLRGRPGGVDADGVEIPPTPATTTIRLTTGEGEVEAKSWFDLAEKLKVKGVKKDSSVTLQKIQVLNFLGTEGWEVMESQGGSPVLQTVGGLGGGGRAAGAGGPGGGGVGGRATVSSASASTTMLLKRRVP